MNVGDLTESNIQTATSSKKKLPYIPMVLAFGVLLLVIIGGLVIFLVKRDPVAVDTDRNNNKQEEVNPTPTVVSEKKETWGKGDYVINGPYADSDIMDLGNGTYRMFYAVEPEVKNDRLSVYSATSTDGINWKQDPGKRATGDRLLASDTIKLSDGKWRMYYNAGGGGIKSAVSTDGLNWTDDPGTRIGANSKTIPEAGRIGFPGAYVQADGTTILVYRGNIEKKYDVYGQVPNNSTELLFWAKSTDGLNFTEQGVAIDSRNSELMGLADGPEIVLWDDGSVRLYFWGYKGIYYSTFTEGTFSAPKAVYKGDMDPKFVMAPNPPSDPTIIKIGSTWFMYYGQHEKGIVYAKLEEK